MSGLERRGVRGQRGEQAVAPASELGSSIKTNPAPERVLDLGDSRPSPLLDENSPTLAAVEYHETPPSPALRPFVRCLWRLRAAGAPSDSNVERVVPDGCPEIVLNRAARFRRVQEDGSSREQARVLLVGQFERAITIAPTGAVDLIGIRFEPGGLHALLGIPMHELANLDLCLGQAEGRLRDELAEAARVEHSSQDALASIEAVLARRLDQRVGTHAGLAGAAVRLARGGQPTAEGLARSLGLNRRALERLFRTEIGLSPKLYLRIARLQAVLQRIDAGPPSPRWAELALAHGFADQSHLIRDFRLLAGTTPERHLAERTAFARVFELGELSRSSNPRP